MLLSLLAASFTFTAVSTGLEKGAAVEFLIAGKASDRDYETMFLLERPLDQVCQELEKRGLKAGTPIQSEKCILWSEGCPITIKPALETFLEIHLPEGIKAAPVIYTGGLKNAKGDLEAATEQPYAFMALYTLAQSPFQFNDNYPQGDVYNAFKVKEKVEKGKKVEFTISWPDNWQRNRRKLIFSPGKIKETLIDLKDAAKVGEVSIEVAFSPELTVADATTVAQALSFIDSPIVKLNGTADGDFFYRAFLPQVKWLDRQQRMQQPFEITIDDNGKEKIIFIEEDWSAPGDDPKLTEHVISTDEVVKHPQTNTAFIYCSSKIHLKYLQSLKSKFPKNIVNWYVFTH